MSNYYLSNALDDILKYVKENIDNNATMIDIHNLSSKKLLKYYLEWNGIIGYHNYIIELLNYTLPIKDEDWEQ